MPKKSLASLNVVINAVTSPLFRGLAKASKRIAKFGMKMKAIGRSISTSFSLPFAAVGVAGAKMAIDFEQSMTKIVTLVGTSADEVNKLSSQVKQMAAETATPAKELADALFFIQSAGIKGAESMQVLEVAAKGASMNMGEITHIASATTSIMQAFGKTSDEAGDLLHETLKQGKFEASEFMNKIGQVIPTAAGLGVSFEELGAAAATMSKLSGDAAGSLTSINAVMMSLGTPGAEQKQILKDLNMSYDDLNAMMKDSLMGTLNHLFTSLEGNDEALVRVFGSSKAVKGAFATAGLQAETYAEVLDGMNNSMGNVDKGFQVQSKTIGFTMAQSLEKLKLAGMELGSVLMPIFTTIADAGVRLAKSFTDLDEGTKKLVVGAAALVAFSGPLATMIGALLSALALILTPIGLVVVALGAIFAVIFNNWEATKTIFINFANYFINLYNESMLFRGAVELVIATFANLWLQIKFTFNSAGAILNTFIDTLVNQFGAVAKMIEGALTLDWDKVSEGGSEYAKTTLDGIKKVGKDIQKEGKILGDGMANNYANALNKTLKVKKVKFISEKDVQDNVDNIGSFLKQKFGKVKDMLQGFLGGSGLIIPGGPGDENSGGSGDPGKTDDGSAEEAAVEKKKNILKKYFAWASKGYVKFADKVAEVWEGIANIASQVINAVSGLFAAQAAKENVILDNKQIRANEDLAKDFTREETRINSMNVSQAKKDEMMLALKKDFDGKQEALDKKMDDKRKALQKKTAMRDKQLAIAQAIMSTASAVVQALTAGPIAGPILAGFVGTLGAAQVAAIASTPIPLARGGIAFGPVNAIVGDNPNAANDPEIIAPLSKLKSMLGNEMNVALNVGGVLKGNDIFLANDNQNSTRERFI